jgi:hypothetical protein
MTDHEQPQVFISYANKDQERVKPFYEELDRQGFSVWMDCFRLRAGQNWDFEIKRAQEKSEFIVTFLSNNSVSRRGYVQREMKDAVDKLKEKLIDDIYLIPVLLDDDIEIPDEVKGIQCIRASNPNFMSELIEAVTFQIGKRGVKVSKAQKDQDFSWSSSVRREEWDGLPGYEVTLHLLELKSEKYPAVVDVSPIIKGDMLRILLDYRSVKLSQSPEFHNYGQDKYRRTNTLEAYFGDPVTKGRVASIIYSVNFYHAQAAHGNHYYKTYAFILDPMCQIVSLRDIFVDAKVAFPKLQELVRDNLLKSSQDEQGNSHLDKDHVYIGTQSFDDFSSFVFREDALEILFAPYHVSAYAAGPQEAHVPYKEIFEFVKPDYASALEIDHLRYRDLWQSDS